MSNEAGFLVIEPLDLRFLFELNKQISCSLRVSNKTDGHVAFKVKTTNPRKYCVRPNSGVVLPRSTCDVTVTMQAQKEAPVDMQCKDKFLIQSIVVNAGVTAKDVTATMFTRESGNVVEECKLRVVYVLPSEPLSPDHEEPKECSVVRPYVSDNCGASISSDLGSITSAGTQRNRSEDTAVYSTVVQDGNSGIQEKMKLKKEFELPQQEARKHRSSHPLVLVMIIAMLAVLLGYIVKK